MGIKPFGQHLAPLVATVLLVCCGGNGSSAEEPLDRFEYSRMEMGVDFRIVLYARNPAVANQAAAAAFDRIHDLNGIFSDYDSQSEAMMLCANSGPGRAIPVSTELFNVLTQAVQMSCQSEGAFDVTVGPLTKLWRRSRRQKALPDAETLNDALARIGYQSIRLHPVSRSVELTKPGMRLDFGGIAQGYAADEALAVLRQHGITRALIDASGDIIAGDPPPGRDAWLVAIETTAGSGEMPIRLKVSNSSVSTSGDAYQFVEISARRYSHIVDPDTGLGLTRRTSVTVIAPTGIQADSLATALCVLGADKGMDLLRRCYPENVDARLLETLDAEPARIHATKRFSSYVVP